MVPLFVREIRVNSLRRNRVVYDTVLNYHRRPVSVKKLHGTGPIGFQWCFINENLTYAIYMYVRSNARVRILRRSKLTMFQSDLHLCFIYAIAKRIWSEYAHLLIVIKLTFLWTYYLHIPNNFKVETDSYHKKIYPLNFSTIHICVSWNFFGNFWQLLLMPLNSLKTI